MKTELSTLDIHYMVKELQQLAGSRVSNIYQPDGFYIQFQKSGTGKMLLRIEPRMLWLTETKPEMPEKIKGFCSLLRKYLKGKKVTSVEQIDGERIIRIAFETQTEKFKLYIELFSNGNIILTDENGIIKKALEERAWKDRTIEKGQIYKLPPGKKNILELTEKELECKSEADIAKMGFGKFYAREMIKRAGDAGKLYDAYKTLISEKINPRAYSNWEIAPFELKQFDEKGEKYESLSKAMDSKFKAEPKKQDKEERAYLKQKEKTETLIRMQEKSANEQETEAAMLQKKGELIYTEYQKLDKMLKELQKAAKTHSLQEIKSKLKGHKIIKDVNAKTSDVVLEL